jgi:hypothetical protein
MEGHDVRIRRHLSYSNVIATLALFVALGGGAYAIDKVHSHEIANGTIKSIDLKNRRAVRAADVKPNGLTGEQIKERTLDAKSFARVAGNEAVDCDPSSSTTFTTCATTTLRLKERSRVLAIATGGQESVSGSARAICEVRIDGTPEAVPAQPGEETTDNTSSSATNGFARTIVTRGALARGQHKVTLACEQFTGNVRIDAPTIAAIAIGSG